MSCNEDVRKLKDNLTLDFNPSSKKIKTSKYIDQKCLKLTTPDVDKLTMSTPEMTKYIRDFCSTATLPTFTRHDGDLDEEKQNKEALEMWLNQTITNNKTVKTVKNDNNSLKDSKPMQPINMEDQEQAKLERKRLRNRIAASKCRQRKLERIDNLKKKVDEYNLKIGELTKWSLILKETNNKLHSHIAKHRELGCDF